MEVPRSSALSLFSIFLFPLAMRAHADEAIIPVVPDAATLQSFVGRTGASGRVYAADLMKGTGGRLFEGASEEDLAAGRYRFHVSLAIGPFGHANISDLLVSVAAGKQTRLVTMAEFPDSDRFVDVAVEFTTASGASIPVSVVWEVGKKSVMSRVKAAGIPAAPAEGAPNLGAGEAEKIPDDEADWALQGPERDEDGTIALKDLSQIPFHLAARCAVIERLPPVRVVSVKTDKVLYEPGEEGSADVVVANASDAAEEVEVRAEIVSELDDRRKVDSQKVQIPARGKHLFSIRFRTSEVEYGHDLRVELARDGRLLAEGSEPFNVADSVWKVCIGGQELITNSVDDKGKIDGQMEEARAKYANWLEKFFWAPDDWAEMTPEPGEYWLSSQGGRYENTEGLQFAIQAAHKRGIRAITYGKAMAYNHFAFEFARRKPEWFVNDRKGRIFGHPGDVAQIDLWRTYDFMADIKAQGLIHPDFNPPRCYPDLRRLDTLDHGINEVIGSAKIFGWDGVRFDSCGFRSYWIDGQTKDGNDAVNTFNMKRLKERVWEALPDFLIGHNANNNPAIAVDGRAYPLSPDDPVGHEFREALAGGCLWMGEAMVVWRNGQVRYTTWSQYARDEVRCIRTIKHYGGHFCYSYAIGRMPGVARNLYKFVIGTLIGAHEYGDAHSQVSGSESWGRFLTRWSAFFWDHRLRPIENPESVLAVESATPLWWKEFANERVISERKRHVILHLLNPPPHDEIAKIEDDLPPHVSDARATLRIPQGEKLANVYFIAPGFPNRVERLEPALEGSSAVVSIPSFAVWTMVVWEIQGKFDAPQSSPKFTEGMTEERMQERQAWDERTARIQVADNLIDPPPQHDEAQDRPRDFGTPAAEMPEGLRVGLRIGLPPEASDKKPPEQPVAADADPSKKRGEPEAKPESAAEDEAELELGSKADQDAAGEATLDVLIVKGLHHYPYRVPEAVKTAAKNARISECTAATVPKTYPEVFQYDVIILADFGAEAWDASGHKMLADFVEAGGRLVVLGGQSTLGQGFFKGTLLGKVLPVEVRPARDVYRLPQPLALGAEKPAAFDGQPLLYYYHATRLRDDSKTLLWAGDLPVLLERKVGKGKSLVFIGTTLGEAQAAGETPFWEWQGWPKVLGSILLNP